MRIPLLFAVASICAGCEPFFDPDIGEGEGEFDGIPEEQVHDLADPLPNRPDLELLNLRIQGVEHAGQVELRPEARAVRVDFLEADLVELRLDGRVVHAELEPTGDGWRLFGLVQWEFDGASTEAVVTGELRDLR